MVIRINKNKASFKAKTIYICNDMHKLSWRITAMADNEVVMAWTLSLYGSKTHPQLKGRKFIIILVQTMAILIRDTQKYIAEISFALHRTTHQNAMVIDILRDGKGGR